MILSASPLLAACCAPHPPPSLRLEARCLCDLDVERDLLAQKRTILRRRHRHWLATKTGDLVLDIPDLQRRDDLAIKPLHDCAWRFDGSEHPHPELVPSVLQPGFRRRRHL